jgi:dihydroxyacetone kinase
VLVIIKNYTGDIINFESAVQVCQFKGMKVRSLVVNDDIAFFDTDNERKEARGLCGTVLLYKMLGAASLMGYSLERLCELGQSIISRTFSLNVSLGACSLPGRQAGFEVAPDCY